MTITLQLDDEQSRRLLEISRAPIDEYGRRKEERKSGWFPDETLAVVRCSGLWKGDYQNPDSIVRTFLSLRQIRPPDLLD